MSTLTPIQGFERGPDNDRRVLRALPLVLLLIAALVAMVMQQRLETLFAVIVTSLILLGAVVWLERVWVPYAIPPEWEQILRDADIERVYFQHRSWRRRGRALYVPHHAVHMVTPEELGTMLDHLRPSWKSYAIMLGVVAVAVGIAVSLPRPYGTVLITVLFPHIYEQIERRTRPPKVARIYDRFRV